MIHFVGAGSGAPDLITIRGKKFLEEADVIIYAGSLVNPQLLDYAKEGCQIYNSAKMTLEEVLDVHVKDFSTFIPWKTRECQNGSKNNQERSQSIKKMVGMLQADDFLGKDFQYVGRYL